MSYSVLSNKRMDVIKRIMKSTYGAFNEELTIRTSIVLKVKVMNSKRPTYSTNINGVESKSDELKKTNLLNEHQRC